jgi:hypothetical protein
MAIGDRGLGTAVRTTPLWQMWVRQSGGTAEWSGGQVVEWSVEGNGRSPITHNKTDR